MRRLALALILVSTAAFAVEPLVVERFAGPISSPIGVAVDRDGTIFVADSAEHVIRKLARNGNATVVAGRPGNPGARDGAASEALFSSPHSIAVDSAGNLFVTDNGNHAVRRISPAGNVTTFAGTPGVSGSNDGTGTAARFFAPHGIAIDAGDNLYVADVANHIIRKITPAGVVITFAGRAGQRDTVDGTGTNARFSFPSGVTVDQAGNIWVSADDTVRRISPAGAVTTIAGTPGRSGYADGSGAAALFNGIEGIAALESGDILAVELGNDVVRAITPAGVVSTVAGRAGETGDNDGIGERARFSNPIGVAVGNDGRILITEPGGMRIRIAQPVDQLPSIIVRGPANDQLVTNGWPLRVEPSGFSFDCARSDDGVLWELLVDGVTKFIACTRLALLPALAPGAHEATVRLVRSDGDPLLPRVEKSLPFVVAPDPSLVYTLLLPGIARTAGGGGSFFRSTAWLTNPSDTAVPMKLTFAPATGFGAPQSIAPVFVTVPPRQMLTFEDVLADVFGVPGQAGGSIVVETAEGAPRPLISARTFNDTPGGTYGQYIEANAVPASSAGDQWIHGLSGNARSRTNLGIFTFDDAAAPATITVHDALGNVIGSPVEVSLPPRSFTQVNSINSAAGAGSVDNFSARIVSTSRFGSYASRLDNVTSDPIYITPLVPRTMQWIDGVGSLPGANSTFFRSMLVLANEQPTSPFVTISYRTRGTDILSMENESQLTTRLAVDEDFIGGIFNRPNTVGWLAIRSTTPITAWVRTYNDQRESGTYGQFIPGFSDDDLFPLTGGILIGVREDLKFRSNFGVVNVRFQPVSITVRAIRDDGAVAGEESFDIGPTQSTSIGRILADLGATDTALAWLEVIPSVDRAVYAWISTVDNRSSDQTFIRPAARP